MLNYASSGAGSSNHMAGELLKVMAKIDLQHVPYKGNNPALTDTIGGHVHMLFAGVPALLPQSNPDGCARSRSVHPNDSPPCRMCRRSTKRA